MLRGTVATPGTCSLVSRLAPGPRTHVMWVGGRQHHVAPVAPHCRAFKAVENTLSDLGVPAALLGPRVMTRATSGTWLALRAEVMALTELRRGLANRLGGGGYDGGSGGASAKRPEKRRRP
jgi:hypothetical protein